MHPSTQQDMGGEAAWQGGSHLIDDSYTECMLYLFALRRFQSLAKIIREPDPTQLVHVSFEALLLAIEAHAPDPAMC